LWNHHTSDGEVGGRRNSGNAQEARGLKFTKLFASATTEVGVRRRLTASERLCLKQKVCPVALQRTGPYPTRSVRVRSDR
jgi:hypothetical protein